MTKDLKSLGKILRPDGLRMTRGRAARVCGPCSLAHRLRAVVADAQDDIFYFYNAILRQATSFLFVFLSACYINKYFHNAVVHIKI